MFLFILFILLLVVAVGVLVGRRFVARAHQYVGKSVLHTVQGLCDLVDFYEGTGQADAGRV